VEAEVLGWYEMTEAERFAQPQDLWEVFVLLGGVYDREPDTQSPFRVFKTSGGGAKILESESGLKIG